MTKKNLVFNCMHALLNKKVFNQETVKLYKVAY